MDPINKNKVNRREFLKLAGLAGASYAAPKIGSLTGELAEDKQNVLIVVFDAWSAKHCSLFGYPRDTTPKLKQIVNKATVFHNHYAAGTWTVPGTSSLLTGSLPWEHRAFGMVHGVVSDHFAHKNIFHHFSDYHRVAYTHNHLADEILSHFFEDIDNLIPRWEWYLQKERLLNVFNEDEGAASVAFNRSLRHEDGYGYSLYMRNLFETLDREVAREGLDEAFPLGVPGRVVDTEKFLLEDGVDYLLDTVLSAPNPFLTYCHFFPPHAPFKTRADFYKRFYDDGYQPLRKPFHVLRREYTYEEMEQQRLDYDEFILYVDAEFARLYELLEQKKVLDNTWLVLTSDHGEIFERGVVKHATFLMHEPIVRIPLVIFEPGQTTRRDVYEKTNAVDLLPTLSHLTGHPPPDWGIGQILPPYADKPGGERDIIIMDSRRNTENAPITEGAFTLIRGSYKLMYYLGYAGLPDGEMIELYDIDTDPEELTELSTVMPGLAAEMLQAVKAMLAEYNEPYL